jgi:hypothetical protein
MKKCPCRLCGPDQRFRCQTCKRVTPWCKGQDDKYYEDCDDCAVKKFKEEEEKRNGKPVLLHRW